VRDLVRVCVFCGSSPGAHDGYPDAAVALGGLLAAEGIGVVYGGGSVGLTGIFADAVLARGGEVEGVLPAGLFEREIAHEGPTKMHVVATMHDRKARMYKLSDAFISLPGGLGTLDELLEIATWAQLGLHHKPIGLLDVDGFFAGLLEFLDHAVDQRFVRPVHRARLLCAREAPALLEALRAFEPLRLWPSGATRTESPQRGARPAPTATSSAATPRRRDAAAQGPRPSSRPSGCPTRRATWRR